VVVYGVGALDLKILKLSNSVGSARRPPRGQNIDKCRGTIDRSINLTCNSNMNRFNHMCSFVIK